MRTTLLRLLICSTVLAQFLPTPYSHADGKLDSFEQEATRQAESRQIKRSHNNSDRSSADYSADFWILPFLALGYGGVSSWVQAKTRTDGQLIIPFVRLDLAYHDVESDVSAGNFSVEAGYGPIAVWHQNTRFKEINPKSTLNLRYTHGLYRMTFGPKVEIDLGVGGIYLDGNQHSSGAGLSLPIKVHPRDSFGLEFRPIWSGINGNSISDYTLTALGGWNHIRLKGGYRWVRTGGASLHGPFAGIAFAF